MPANVNGEITLLKCHTCETDTSHSISFNSFNYDCIFTKVLLPPPATAIKPMHMSDKTILQKAENLATDILQNQVSKELSYHNYDHTLMVVEAAQLIAKAQNLNGSDLEALIIAAWFHDTGFKDAYEGHEEKSVEIAEAFLKEENASPELIEKVRKAILCTQMGKEPQSEIEKILCDSDLFHTTQDYYEEHAAKLRKELSTVKKQNFTDLEWYQNSLEFVSRHHFQSEYGQTELKKAKEKVRAKIEKKLSKLQKQFDKGLISELGVTPAELKAMKKKLQKAEGRPERGIETMFRLTSKNHLDLSGMADSKANIMISVNSIIISILIGALMQKLDNNPHLIAPTVILLTVNLGSMVFAILSIRPNVTDGLFTREDIENQRTNLLFFGNFHKMKRDDYHWGMNQLMENASFLYSNLIDDIYFLGVVLATKYRYLRYSYNVFMYGIVVAVIAFVISNFWAEPKM